MSVVKKVVGSVFGDPGVAQQAGRFRLVQRVKA